MRKYRIKQVTFLDGFAAGLTAATIAFLIFFMFIQFPIENGAWIGVFGSILVALFSIGAASLALFGNKLQIKTANDVEDERIRNSLLAARALLPAVLSQICAVATNNIRLKFDPSDLFGDEETAVEFQTLPESIIPPLKECIQYSDSVSQERLANILRHTQVFQARRRVDFILRHNDDYSPDLHAAISEVIAWATIYALTEDAFRFARGSQNAIPAELDANRVRSAMLLCGVIIENYPHLQQILDTRIEGGRIENDWS